MRKLLDLDIKRIALVDKAANRRRFLLHKREEDETMTEEEKLAKEKADKEAKEKEDKEVKEKADKEEKERKEKEENTVPVEVLAAGMPDEVKSEIGGALKSLNAAIGSLAKLMGYGYSSDIKAPEKEKTKEKESQAELDETIETLTETIKTMGESIVTREDVEKMIGDITGKKD